MDASEYKKEFYEKGKNVASELSSVLNSMTYEEEVIKGFVEGITLQHRTLQQSSMRAILVLISEWAKMEENKRYDLRNEATVKMCKKIKDFLDKEDLTYLPFV